MEKVSSLTAFLNVCNTNYPDHPAALTRKAAMEILRGRRRPNDIECAQLSRGFDDCSIEQIFRAMREARENMKQLKELFKLLCVTDTDGEIKMFWDDPARVETTKLLRFLPILFKTVHVQKLHPHAEAWLKRAGKQGVIREIDDGHFLNEFKCKMADKWPEIEDVSFFLRKPSYVTQEWALLVHGVLGQCPYTCTAATLKPAVTRRYEVIIDDYRILYSEIEKDLFWGFDKNGDHYMATPEKALLDCAYLDNRIPFADELDYEFLDLVELTTQAAKFPVRVQKMIAEFVEMIPEYERLRWIR